MKMTIKIFFLIATTLFFAGPPALANSQPDSDRDGVPDFDEISVYMTDIYKADTDGDGYSDWAELNSGYSPHNPKPARLEDNDHDSDGLSDRMELNFGTNLADPDTDGDGHTDGEEIKNGFNPKGEGELLKRIEINIAKQELSYFLGGVRMGKYPVSSGKYNSTPRGHYYIRNKAPKAWSSYGLWMPWWMGLDRGRIGIHELPYWPNGYVEGEDHLGKPVSHGCIRLGRGPAKILYDWAPAGTGVFIY